MLWVIMAQRGQTFKKMTFDGGSKGLPRVPPTYPPMSAICLFASWESDLDEVLPASELQGYLAHKNPPTPLGTP